MKKVLSLVLVIAMVLSSMSFAFASTFEDIADTDYAKAIETLTALGVVNGYEDGTYRPEKTVTRAEMAKLLVEILGYGNLVAGSKSNFTDTQGHWADAWIALAAGKGIVIGTGEGKFTPDRTVSYDEAITMVVRALGYTDSSNELKNMTWPTNFKVKAAELDLLDGVKLGAGADRGGVAQLLFNALEAVLVTVNSDGDVVESKNELLSRLATYDSSYVVGIETIDEDSKNYGGNLVDLAPYMYQDLKVYLNKDDEVVYIKGTNSLVVEGSVDKVEATTVNLKDAAGKIVKVPFATEPMFYNGAEIASKNMNTITTTYEYVTVVAMEGTSSNGKIEAGEIVGVVATEPTRVAQITKEYVTGRTKLDVFTLPVVDGDVDLDNITVTGAVDSLEDIAEDDVVVEYKAADDSVTKLVVSRDAVDGEVTRIDGSNFYIDGVKYARNKLVTTAWELGDEGTFFLDHNGKLVAFEGVSGPTSYAVVMGSDDGLLKADRVDATKYTIDDYPVIKLATQDDERITYEVAVTINSNGTVKSSAKVNTSAMVAKDGSALELTGVPAAGQIVKYTVDANGRISKITTVAQPSVSYADKAKVAFASNVVIFDATTGENYAVVSYDRLEKETAGSNDKAVYNSDGEIVVLYTDDVKAGSDTTFAYISKINKAKDSAGDNVQLVTLYLNGVKVEYYTDAEDTVAAAQDDTVVEVDLDGVVVVDAIDVTANYILATTASAVYAKVERVVLADGTNAYLADNATIITIEADGDVVLSDLYDIEEGVTEFDVYFNADDEIAFIVINE